MAVPLQPRILLVDDDPDIHRLVRAALDGLGELDTRHDVDGAATALDARPDVVLLDLDLAGGRGEDVLEDLIQRSPLSTVFVMSGVADLERAVAMMRKGAEDFLVKPVSPVQLRRRVERALVRHRLASQLALRVAPEDSPRDASFEILQLGASTAMQRLCDAIRTIAGSQMTVLVQGPTGTGKELVARALHGLSRRSGEPFVALNCGALPRELMEAELFGHASGAFTGATTARRGLILEAAGGTLVLDEIGELPLPLQPKLLRFLQEGEIRPVGSDRTQRVDVRVIATTHLDLQSRVKSGDFREDLFFRLSVLPIRVPALAERQSDIPGLAELFRRESVAHAGRELKGFERGALRALMAQPWPGNVRELQNVVRRAMVYAEGPLITAEDLGLDAPVGAVGIQWPADLIGGEFREAKETVVADFEHAYVTAALTSAKGNVAEAARASGLPRKSFWRIARRVGLVADRASRRRGRLLSGSRPTPDVDSGPALLEEFLAAERTGYWERGLATVQTLRGLQADRPGLEHWSALRGGAHRLKGSGTSYGFPEVSAAAGDLEEEAERLNPEACLALLKKIEGALVEDTRPEGASP
jgi:DNA-binding NtrC family response regulator